MDGTWTGLRTWAAPAGPVQHLETNRVETDASVIEATAEAGPIGSPAMGWEVASRLELERPSILDRLRPGWREIRAGAIGVAAFLLLFLVSCWLAGNPFSGTQRVPSDVVVANGWVGTGHWAVFWWVVAIAVVLEFLDASAGMGYGTAITPLLSGVPVKSMLAVTSIAEGTVCLASIAVWLAMLAQGVVIDFLLLPSMLLGSMIAAVAAPYATRVLPERLWRFVVPMYCCILAAFCFWKIAPQVVARLAR